MGIYEQDDEQSRNEKDLATPVDTAEFQRKQAQHADQQWHEEDQCSSVFLNAIVPNFL